MECMSIALVVQIRILERELKINTPIAPLTDNLKMM